MGWRMPRRAIKEALPTPKRVQDDVMAKADDIVALVAIGPPPEIRRIHLTGGLTLSGHS